MSSQPENSEWLVYVPDFANSADQRAALFAQHAERRKTDPSDFWVLGGATLEDPVSQGQPPKITGSAMIVYAPTRQHVLTRLEDDPLTKGQVWDLENAQIHPFFRPKRVPV